MWFNFKKKKEEKQIMKKANNIVKEMVLQKALEENKEKQATIDKIKKICEESKTSKVAKQILTELGE